MKNNSEQPNQPKNDSQVPNQGFTNLNYVQSQIYFVQREGEYRCSANYIAKKIYRLLNEDPMDVGDAYGLLKELQEELEIEASVQNSSEYIYTTLLEFREKMSQNYDFQKLVQLQLLSFMADTIMRFIDENHPFKYTSEEIMTNLAVEVVPMSTDFLIENATNSELWCLAVKRQNIKLIYNKRLMMIIIDFLDQPWVFKILLGQKNIPYYQQVCNKAWEQMRYVPDAMRFIFQEIYEGGDYYEGFLEFEIYEVFEFLIFETMKLYDKWNQVNTLYLALECLSSMWADDQMFSDTEQIFKSNLLYYISHIPIDLFNQEGLSIIHQFVRRIDNNSNYDLNSIIINSLWYQRLNVKLLYQQMDNVISQNTILRLEQLCQGCLSLQASQQIQQIISEYQEALQQVAAP